MNVLYVCLKSKEIGWGHYMRCKALQERLPGEMLIGPSLEHLRIWGDYDIVVSDVPVHDSRFVDKLRYHGERVVCIDDHSDIFWKCHVLVSPGLTNRVAEIGPQTKLLAGLQYVPLRQQFREYHWQPSEKVYLSVGSGDVKRHGHALRAMLKDITVEPDGEDVASVMAGCRAAIVGGGITLYEALALGVPAIVLPQNEAQGQEAEAIQHLGGCFVVKDELEAQKFVVNFPGALLSRLSFNGQQLIDGKGADRIAEVLLG